MNEERGFYEWLRGRMDHTVHVQRIENTTSSGVPDLNMCCQGREVWIELKVKLKQGILLRKEQYAWLHKRGDAMGTGMVVVKDGDDFEIHLGHLLTIEPYSGYLRITSEPWYRGERKGAPIQQIIFRQGVYSRDHLSYQPG